MKWFTGVIIIIRFAHVECIPGTEADSAMDISMYKIRTSGLKEDNRSEAMIRTLRYT